MLDGVKSWLIKCKNSAITLKEEVFQNQKIQWNFLIYWKSKKNHINGF